MAYLDLMKLHKSQGHQKEIKQNQLPEEQEPQQEISQKRTTAKEAAINLFQREVTKLSPTQKARLSAYITSSFNSLNCCVLYTRSSRFSEFLKSIGISPDLMEKKEILINQQSKVFFSKDYSRSSPRLYF